MKILIISDKASPPQAAITALLDSMRLTKISATPAMLLSLDLDNADCAIYIDHQPYPQIIDKLQESRCPSILVANQDFLGNQCLFIPFDILDRSISVDIGIGVIHEYLNSIEINESPDSSRSFGIQDISQIRQARRESNFFDGLVTC